MIDRLIEPQDSTKYDYEYPNDAEIIGGIPTFTYNFFRDVWQALFNSYLVWFWVIRLIFQ